MGKIKDTTFNGWSNYETWLKCLWITNNYTCWRVAARTVRKIQDPKENIREVVEALKNAARLLELDKDYKADMQSIDDGLVNWREIAQSFIAR